MDAQRPERMSKAEELRKRATQHKRDAQESWERSDTDGFVSQWASGLNAALARTQASIEEAGGVATFFRYKLETIEGEPVEAKLIRGKFGPCWALTDAEGEFTGKFIGAHPVRESTLTRKGYREVKEEFVAEAEAAHWAPPGATGLSGAHLVQTIVRPVERGVQWDGVATIGTHGEDD